MMQKQRLQHATSKTGWPEQQQQQRWHKAARNLCHGDSIQLSVPVIETMYALRL
jgi:hypothetical protein